MFVNDRHRANNYLLLDPSWDGVHDAAACDLEEQGGVSALAHELRVADEARARRQFDQEQAALASERARAAMPTPVEVEWDRVRF